MEEEGLEWEGKTRRWHSILVAAKERIYLEVNPTHRQMIAELEAEADAAAAAADDDAMEDVL